MSITIRLVQASGTGTVLVIDGENPEDRKGRQWLAFDDPVELMDAVLKALERIGVKNTCTYIDDSLTVWNLESHD